MDDLGLALPPAGPKGQDTLHTIPLAGQVQSDSDTQAGERSEGRYHWLTDGPPPGSLRERGCARHWSAPGG
jgi:hypothetical protein